MALERVCRLALEIEIVAIPPECRPVEPAAAMIERLTIVVRTREGVVAFTQELDLSADDGVVALARRNRTIVAQRDTLATSD